MSSTSAGFSKLKSVTSLIAAIAIVAIAAVMYFSGNDGGGTPPPSSGHPWTQPLSEEARGRALTSLDTLRVAEKDDRGDYDRKAQFGSPWTDKAEDVALAGNSCDTRNDILARDMTEVTYRDSKQCKVDTGKLWDPYTGRTINFKYGPTSGAVQIEHLVALKDVWMSGGDALSQRDRIRVANDPINLIAADGPTNGAKGNKHAGQWMPPYEPIHCYYVASQIRVKEKYNLTVSADEKKAMESTLASCTTV